MPTHLLKQPMGTPITLKNNLESALLHILNTHQPNLLLQVLSACNLEIMLQDHFKLFTLPFNEAFFD